MFSSKKWPNREKLSDFWNIQCHLLLPLSSLLCTLLEKPIKDYAVCHDWTNNVQSHYGTESSGTSLGVFWYKSDNVEMSKSSINLCKLRPVKLATSLWGSKYVHGTENIQSATFALLCNGEIFYCLKPGHKLRIAIFIIGRLRKTFLHKKNADHLKG